MVKQRKNKFRASFTVLDLWAKGLWEEAIKAYFKMDRFVSPEMEEGKEYHQKWSLFIKENSRLPDIFGGKALENPLCEEKVVAPLFDWCDLVGKVDCLEKSTVFEFKTGVSSSQDHARSIQTPVYGLLATLANRYIKKAEIHHYNQYSKRVDMSILWLTDASLRNAFDFIETHASEMHNYFLQNNLYEKLSLSPRAS